MNGCIASGKLDAAKKTPEQIHIGAMTTFMMPDTPSTVCARLAVSSPRPPKVIAPSSDTAARAPGEPSIGTPNSRRAKPTSTTSSSPSSTRRAVTRAARYWWRRIGVAISRLSSLRERCTTSVKPMPHMPVPMMFMPSRPGISQSM